MPITHMHGCRFPIRSGDPLSYFGAGGYDITQGRTGYGYSTRTTTSSTAAPTLTITLAATFSVGFALRIDEAASSSTSRIYIGEASSGGDYLSFAPFVAPSVLTIPSGTSAWTVRNADTTPAGWHWFNITGVLNHATAGHVRVYRNGTLILEKGSDTQPPNPYSRAILIHMGEASRPQIISDIVIRDDNVLIPDSRVDTLLPNGDVDALWTPSTGTTRFPVVTDGLTTTWVASSTVGQQQRFALEDLPHSPASVEAVRLNLASGKDDDGPRTMAVLVNGVEGAVLDSGSLDYRSQIYLTDPADSQPWTAAKVNGMTVGAVVKA